MSQHSIPAPNPATPGRPVRVSAAVDLDVSHLVEIITERVTAAVLDAMRERPLPLAGRGVWPVEPGPTVDPALRDRDRGDR